MCKLNEVEIVDTFEEFMSKINRKRELEHKLRHNNEKIYDRYKACDLKSYEFMTTLCSDGFYMFEKGYINPDLIYSHILEIPLVCSVRIITINSHRENPQRKAI